MYQISIMILTMILGYILSVGCQDRDQVESTLANDHSCAMQTPDRIFIDPITGLLFHPKDSAVVWLKTSANVIGEDFFQLRLANDNVFHYQAFLAEPILSYFKSGKFTHPVTRDAIDPDAILLLSETTNWEFLYPLRFRELLSKKIMDNQFVDMSFDYRKASLRGANLSKRNFRGADLRSVDLREANLVETNFREANLREANFREANLRGANFRGANLYRANFYRANLQGANFRGANLHGANLREANLLGVRF